MTRLRSAAWFATDSRDGVIHRSAIHLQGFDAASVLGRPVIGIANSASELVPCNAHLGRLAEAVKRGIWQAGGFPLEFHTMSLGENLMRPTTMLFRNLMAMEVEETLRANPLDGVVLLAGCDKTVPAQLMGAASVDLPSIMLTAGPQLTGRFLGKPTGPTDVWRTSEDVRAGVRPASDLYALESCNARSSGHCSSMGTASTMACLVEAMGLQLPGGATLPAVDGRRTALAQVTGQTIVEMVERGRRMSTVLTRASFRNAVAVLAAIGGSTNAVVHLLALAGRLGVPFTLDDFDAPAEDIPTLVDLQPAGRLFMEDFAYAGGMSVLLDRIRDRLDMGAMTVTGATLEQSCPPGQRGDAEVIREVSDPVRPPGSSIAVLRGNICPDGAVIKRSATSAALLTHRGRALVFDSIEEYNAARDDPTLAVDATSVLVVRNAGPVGYPGMPEVGNLQLPRVLLGQGVRDIVRISDARMSGTAYGTVVLHVAPEAAVGGPLALIRTGDWIALDVTRRRLDVELTPKELDARREQWTAPPAAATRGYERLYIERVLQADQGADLDFLRGGSGSGVPRESH